MLLRFLVISLVSCCALEAVDLHVVEKKIEVDGREAPIYAITQPDSTLGIRIKANEPFDVRLTNSVENPTSVHWHGLICPNAQDGVAFVTQYAVFPTLSYHYQFPLRQSGTFWMHSHVGLQIQRLLSAPLIIESPEDTTIADQDVVIFLTDFSFTSASAILEDLRCKDFSNKKNSPLTSAKPDSINPFNAYYDAYLANYRTLKNPEIIKVKPGTKVRLRIINGSSATNFFINLGKLVGEAIAVDGNRIKPFRDSLFELADAQRIDIVVKIPAKEPILPILAQAEGTDRQTGVILVTKDHKLPEISEKALTTAGYLTNVQERKLEALNPLEAKKVDKQLIVTLGGQMAPYVWTIDGQSWPENTPLIVEEGQRVELIFKNNSPMGHPMHFHGHVFQVKAINDQPLNGALRDTVLVPAHSTLTIEFDANNKGVWALHCHILYHQAVGMFTVVRYSNFVQPL